MRRKRAREKALPTAPSVMVPTVELEAAAAPYNPRRISDRELMSLRRSIRSFGFVDPVVLNQRTNTVVGGHQRIKAARLEGLPELPVVYVDLDAVKEKQLNLALNRIGGEWEDSSLGELLKELASVDADLTVTGFEDSEINALLGELGDKPKDREKKPPGATAVKAGDLWRLGDHRLFCGDSTNAELVGAVLDGAKPILQVMDPPFEVDYSAWGVLRSVETVYAWGRGTRFLSWLSSLNQDKWERHELLFAPFNLTEYEAHEVAFTGVRARGLYSRNLPVLVHEVVHILRRGKDKSLDRALLKALNTRLTKDGRHFSVFYDVLGDGKFPYGKGTFAMEVGLVYTAPRAAVWDPCLGGGATLLACERRDRVCYGFELDPAVCDLIISRWEELTGRKAEKA